MVSRHKELQSEVYDLTEAEEQLDDLISKCNLQLRLLTEDPQNKKYPLHYDHPSHDNIFLFPKVKCYNVCSLLLCLKSWPLPVKSLSPLNSSLVLNGLYVGLCALPGPEEVL